MRAKRLELIRLWHQILNLARLPFRHARTLHTTRMALRLPTPKSGRLFIILYAPSLVKAETAIFFRIARKPDDGAKTPARDVRGKRAEWGYCKDNSARPAPLRQLQRRA